MILLLVRFCLNLVVGSFDILCVGDRCVRGSAHYVCGSIERMMGLKMVEYTSVYLLISIDLGSRYTTKYITTKIYSRVSREGFLHYFCLVKLVLF